eukprot:8721574-Alexandrium_andersonii.AAC.1
MRSRSLNQARLSEQGSERAACLRPLCERFAATATTGAPTPIFSAGRTARPQPLMQQVHPAGLVLEALAPPGNRSLISIAFW